MSHLSKFTLLSCLIVHTQLFIGNWWISYMTKGISPIFWSMFQGILYLLYPVYGWIAENLFSNLKMINLSFVGFMISSVIILFLSIGEILIRSTNDFFDFMIGSYLIVGLISLGMFEASAIQFGMDQMMEASSEQLSSFIHWYFCHANVGPLVTFYIVIGTLSYSIHCKIRLQHFLENAIELLYGWTGLVFSSAQLLLSSTGLCLCICYGKHYPIEITSRNPLSIVFKVLKYSYKHEYPENRSAFTYWENDVPSRIDLGKEKYGGPFTYEQVEDVKAMFRLLLLMVSLFGFHISGDGYSVVSYTLSKIGCPTFATLAFVYLNPQQVSFITVLLGVPLIQLMKKQKCFNSLNLLRTLRIGLVICLVNEALVCIYSNFLPDINFDCPQLQLVHNYKKQEAKCLAATAHVITNGSSCEPFCTLHSSTSVLFYFPLVSFLLNGLSCLMVFMTMVEFICAQSPNAMKGLLIGIWYSMLSIKSFAINVLDNEIIHKDTYWSIYHGAKGLSIFVSIIMFSMVSKRYKYRERNEIVNEQAMIEEQYERELLLNSESNHITSND